MSLGLRLAAALLLGVGSGALVPSTAHAASCSTAEGVTVVVDFKELGGGVVVDCVGNNGGTASTLFRAAGHTLTQVTGQPGFVCRVDGLPSADEEGCNNTPPPDAYWGLWWSDGESGSWTYATGGAYSQQVPEGGSVAFSWNGSTTRTQPGATPPVHEDSEPTDQPSAPPSSGGGEGPGPRAGGAGDGQDGSTPSASTAPESGAPTGPPAARQRGEGRKGSRDDDTRERRGDRDDRTRDDRDRDRRDEPSPATGDTTTAPADAEVTSEPVAADTQGGLPGWVAPAGIVGLFAVAGGAAYLRRRTA